MGHVNLVKESRTVDRAEEAAGVRLAHAFAAGAEGALEEIYKDVSPLVFTLASRALGDQTEAEDVTQQTFVAAWRSRSSFDPDGGALRGWIVGIARKAIADALEHRSRDRRRLEAVRDAPPVPVRDLLDDLVLAYEIEALGDPR